MEHQDLFKKHSDFIWDIANLLRGPYRPPQYRRVMIPLNEQDELLLAQQTRTARLEKHAESVANAIARPQEYRTALITAAVTGQIDVRSWQAAVPSKEPEADKEVA